LRVQGSGFRVQVSALSVQCSLFRVQGLGRLEFRVEGAPWPEPGERGPASAHFLTRCPTHDLLEALGFGASGLGFGVRGSGFGVLGFGLGV